MRQRPRKHVQVYVVVVAIAVGTLGVGTTWSNAQAPEPPLEETFDDTMAAVARAVPGFAGVTRDGSTLVVRMVSGGDRAARQARDELSRHLDVPGLKASTVRTEPAQFAFDDLKSWFDTLSARLMNTDAAVFLDIDERVNRIILGSSNPEASRRDVDAALQSSSAPIPRSVVEVVQSPLVELDSSLQDPHRPLVGGLQIASSTKYCTLGYVAVRDGANGFVTNSHCTDSRNGLDGTIFGQSEYVPRVGVEAVDPPVWTGGACPAGRRCRYSDAAWIRTDSLTSTSRGRIAAPTHEGGIVWV